MDVKIGDQVRVLRQLDKRSREYTYTVRAIKDDEVRIDNGIKEVDDARRNGFTIAAWVSVKNVTPWDDPIARRPSTWGYAQRIIELETEVARLQALLDAAVAQRTQETT